MSDTSIAPAVELRDLRFTWRSAERPVLDIPHWQLARGDTVFLQGESGSGKSTLLALLAGVLVAQQGSVQLLGGDWAGEHASRRDRHRVAPMGGDRGHAALRCRARRA